MRSLATARETETERHGGDLSETVTCPFCPPFPRTPFTCISGAGFPFRKYQEGPPVAAAFTVFEMQN